MGAKGIIFKLCDVSVFFNKKTIHEPSIQEALARLFSPVKPEVFFALRQVSISIAQGERVGLIGRNGSGKSTLLRVFSKIIVPQQGTVFIDQTKRIVPLLELGIGFQPELSGRENCLLSGAIFGLSPAEVRSKMNRIENFAEIGDFIDEPVKTYSSGMLARLAFALSIAVEPNVLLLDEILGVGDEFFFRKCVVAMQKLMNSGVTVILVSHNLDFLVRQCSRLIWLHQGRIVVDGDPGEVAATYRENFRSPLEA